MYSRGNRIHHWLNRRSVGVQSPRGTKDQLATDLYSCLKTVNTWNPKEHPDHTHHGGIFNFDYATDGSLLVAACERQSFLMFDPLSGKLISTRNDAHSDCVNCVRFLDSRMFATCSDDTTVCLWDARYIKYKVRTLKGHANWVKNIEYAHNAELLVTSGFDGSIYAWDINRYADSESCQTRLFHTNGLMRSKLTPDASKLILATAGGYLMVVHNLDLNTLSSDLHGFKPNMYRLMQMSQQPIRQGYQNNHVFTRKRNRVELISDFPEGNDAEMIASLEVHPQGWCVVSRNTSSEDKDEWTCVHDIQDTEESPHVQHGNESLLESGEGKQQTSVSTEPDKSRVVSQREVATARRRITLRRSRLSSEENRSEARTTTSTNRSGSTAENVPSQPLQTASPPFIVSFAIPNNGDPGNSSSIDHEADLRDGTVDSSPGNGDSSVDAARERNDCPTESPNDEDRATPSPTPALQFSPAQSVTLGESVTFIIRSGAQVAERTLLLLGQNAPRTQDVNVRIQRNRCRLTHYIEEPNVGRGFIKEICFSNDGRLICSPFGFGLRLLAFGPNCEELCDVQPSRPMQLHELTSRMCHTSSVVASKFSPTHSFLVTGCLNGKIVFHQPVF